MVKTVLIVDDDEDIRLMLRTYLRLFDFETREAGNACQALAAAQ